jgi:hypothetical protein
MRVMPHLAQNTNGCRSAIDRRTTRHADCAISLYIPKRFEEAFRWIKDIAGRDKTKFRDVDRVGFAFTFARAYDLVRRPKLLVPA